MYRRCFTATTLSVDSKYLIVFFLLLVRPKASLLTREAYSSCFRDRYSHKTVERGRGDDGAEWEKGWREEVRGGRGREGRGKGTRERTGK